MNQTKSADEWILNRELNQLETAGRKIVLDSNPLTFMAILTTRCNIRCIMCTRVRLKPLTLPFKIVKKIYSLFPYLERVDWQGGEVFLVDYFKELFLKTASFPHILQNINTNALLIDEEWAKIFAQSNVSLLCSIDSVKKPTYEYIRQGGRFEDLLNSLDLINDAYRKYKGSIKLDLIAIVMKRNYQELLLFPEFCKKYNFRSLFFDTLWPELVPEENILSNPDINTVQYLREVVQEVKYECRKYNIHFYCAFESHLVDYRKQEDNSNRRENVLYLNEKKDLQDSGCIAPWNNLFIDVDGQVRPECKCFRVAGNIRCNSWEEIWNGEIMQLYRRSIKDKKADKVCSDMCKFYATLRRQEEKETKVY